MRDVRGGRCRVYVSRGVVSKLICRTGKAIKGGGAGNLFAFYVWGSLLQRQHVAHCIGLEQLMN
jgi:hypothetical protein